MNWIATGWSAQGVLAVAFVLTALVVLLSGTRLSVYGDALGKRTGLGSGFAGLIFLAAVTSLPELVVSVSAALRASVAARRAVSSVEQLELLRQGADLATGNLIGSNGFNLLLLAGVSLFCGLFRPGYPVHQNHFRPAGQGALLLILFAIAFASAPLSGAVIPLLGCGVGSLLVALAAIAFLHHSGADGEEQESIASELPQKQCLARFGTFRFYSALCGWVALIVLAGTALSMLAGRMALPPDQGGFGLQESLIGSLFLAVSTSIPELVVCISCVRFGFFDLAIGNVLGSNLFNLLLVLASDLALRGGSLLRCAGRGQWVMLAGVTLMAGLSIGLMRPTRRVGGAHRAFLPGLMIAIYLLAATVSFFH